MRLRFPSPWDELATKPDLNSLYEVISKLSIAHEQISAVVQRLIRPPLSLGQNLAPDPEAFLNSTVEISAQSGLVLKRRIFDPHAAVALLRLENRYLAPEVTWKMLSRAERKSAKLLWDFSGKSHGLNVTQRGHPTAIDPALVLYCVRVLCEASGKAKFQFKRPMNGGPPGGPMWRALLAALPMAQLFLAQRFGTPVIDFTRHAESLAEIVHLTCTPHFKERPEELAFGDEPDDVAINPFRCRAAVSYARQARRRKWDLFRRGKVVLGQNASGLISKLLAAKEKNIALARSAIETASTKENPREYVRGVIQGAAPCKTSLISSNSF
jgi:hypothetical protein